MTTSSNIGRRHMLAASGALAAAAALPRPGTADFPYIDAHSHLWSPDRKDYPLAPGAKEENVKPKGFDIGTFFSVAGPEGVGRVVAVGHNAHFGTDASYLLDLLKARPGQLAVQAVVDLKAPDPDKRMLELKAQGVRAFRIVLQTPWTEYLPEHHPVMQVYQTAAMHRLAICPLTNPDWLPQFDRLSEMFPATTVVLDHFARIGVDGFGQTPPVPGTLKPEDIANLAKLARHPLTHVKISAYYALGRRTPPYEDMLPFIQQLIAAFGPERLMWGSDSPYQWAEGQGYHASISLIRDRLEVSVPDREWLLRKTAERVFFS